MMNNTKPIYLIKMTLIAVGLTLGLGFAARSAQALTAAPLPLLLETRRQGDGETRRRQDAETRRQDESPCHRVTVSPCHPISQAPLLPGSSAQTGWTPPSPAYKVFVKADGIYQLSYAYLQAAGLPVDTLDPRTFRLFYMGQEVPIQVEGESDGHFDPGDVVLFYGRSVDSLFYAGLLPTNKYTGTNVYWLTYGGSNGLRMAEKDGSLSGSAAGPFLHTEHLEQNYAYESARPFAHNADHWYWQKIQVIGLNNTASRSYSFTADNVATDPFTGTLTVNLLGYYNGPHHLRLYVNNNLVLDDGTSWSNFDVFSTTVDVPQAYFQEGTNTIKVEVVNDVGKPVDQIYTNWLEARYYDTHVAEGDKLAFGNNVASTWRYAVSNFSSSDITVYDVSNHTAVQRFTSTTVTGSGPYTVSFGDTVSGNSRYLALTSAARLTPAGIAAVTHLTSSFTPSDLLSTSNGADYIIVTHGNFWDKVLMLAAYRAATYRVAVVDVQEIYDQFNGGLMSAEAIHDFLAYAYQHWQPPAPAFVLLLGDGTNDMRNYLGNSGPTYIPPYLYLADPTLGETAADNRFVTLVGNDIVPDMHIGRLPANTPAEAEAMIRKIVAYENTCCEPLPQNVLFIADDLEGGGGNFYEYSDSIADGYADPPTNTIKYLPAPYTATKVYLGQTCDVVGNPSLAVECRQQITRTLNITGALLMSYIGHATKTEWAAERLWDQSALATLTNTNACYLPIMLPMTCFEGFFHEPGAGFQSLGEASVRIADIGAVASWSPTGFGLANGHDLLEQGFFLALFHEGVEELGPITTWAKQYLLDKAPLGQYDDLVDTFVLLGDPALKVKRDNSACIPTAVRIASFSARPQGKGVLVEWQTASESDVLGFNVLRSEAPDGDFVAVNEELIFATKSGSGGGAAYAYRDEQVAGGKTYYYALEIVKLDGRRERYGLAQVTVASRWLYLPVVM